MVIEIEDYVDFIVKNNLTQTQFLFLYLLHFERYDLMKKYMSKFPTEDGTFLGIGLREDLVNRNFIIKTSEEATASSYKIGEAFKDIFIDKIVAGNEFWDLYPIYVMSNGKRLPLNLMDKYDFYRLYGQRINYQRKEHEEVMKDLQYAIDNYLIFGKIETFVKSEQWQSIRKIRLDQPVITIEDVES